MLEKYKRNIKKFFLLGAMFLLPIVTNAQTFDFGSDCPTGGLCNPIEASTLTEFLGLVLDALQLIVFPFVVLFLIYGGFKFISAQGNPEKINEAKRIFLWVLVGALIVLGARVLSEAIDASVKNIRGGVEKPPALVMTHPDVKYHNI